MSNITNITQLSASETYQQWVAELKQRYLSLRLKAAVDVNRSLLSFYWSVGEDIACKQYANTYGSAFYATLSNDMRRDLPNVKGLSENNIRYMFRFYSLYATDISSCQSCDNNSNIEILPHPAEKSVASIFPQGAEDLKGMIFSIPWDHHRRIIDKCKGNTDKALFYVRKTLENNWGRDMLLNFLGSDLYEREGNAISNFKATLPAVQSDLAQQITKDPYDFDFLTLLENYNERELEDALVANVTRFLLELGSGFAYMGRQFRLSVDSEEFFPDLLFYNAKIHAYCVVELKVGAFNPRDLGQLGFYVSVVNDKFKSETDNPTIGLLICREKSNIVARYALEASSQPIGISEYQLSKVLSADFKGSLPTIEEIEAGLESREKLANGKENSNETI